MSIGLMIITHDNLGRSLLDAATGILGLCPLTVKTLPVARDSDPDLLRQCSRTMLADLDRGDGVLVLTDLYGSTPANIAADLAGAPNVRVISGINLPMLIRVFNYASLDLASLTEKALSGGNAGIVEYQGTRQ